MSNAPLCSSVFFGFGILIVGYLVSRFLLWVLGFRNDTKPTEQRPEPPCGNASEHYYWRDQEWPCPICTSIRDRKNNTVFGRPKKPEVRWGSDDV